MLKTKSSVGGHLCKDSSNYHSYTVRGSIMFVLSKTKLLPVFIWCRRSINVQCSLGLSPPPFYRQNSHSCVLIGNYGMSRLVIGHGHWSHSWGSEQVSCFDSNNYLYLLLILSKNCNFISCHNEGALYCIFFSWLM